MEVKISQQRWTPEQQAMQLSSNGMIETMSDGPMWSCHVALLADNLLVSYPCLCVCRAVEVDDSAFLDLMEGGEMMMESDDE